MAEVDPNTPQVVDPERTVDLTRLLQIRGPLGVLNVLDTIVPVVNMGDVVARTVTVQQPSFRTTDIFSNGWTVVGSAGLILADTGALEEGTYDVLVHVTANTNVSQQRVETQIRNAANTANLAVWAHGVGVVTEGTDSFVSYSLALELGINERLRIIQVLAGLAGHAMAAIIFARRRA